ncbi:MAG: hypothetical protein HCAMLNBO_01056 [Candidatus Brocadia fulgida]|nr:hypothetical protein [Candidatus Brocadia fulgida]
MSVLNYYKSQIVSLWSIYTRTKAELMRNKKLKDTIINLKKQLPDIYDVATTTTPRRRNSILRSELCLEVAIDEKYPVTSGLCRSTFPTDGRGGAIHRDGGSIHRARPCRKA